MGAVNSTKGSPVDKFNCVLNSGMKCNIFQQECPIPLLGEKLLCYLWSVSKD